MTPAKPVKKDKRTRRWLISAAVRDLDSALLVLKENFEIEWTSACFRSLRYLEKLAREVQ